MKRVSTHVFTRAIRVLSLPGKPRALMWLATDWLSGKLPELVPAFVPLMRAACRIFGFESLNLKLLMFQHRVTRSEHLIINIREKLPCILDHVDELMGPSNISAIPNHGRFLRAIVLRAPDVRGGTISKGVLLIKFTETFRYFYHYLDIGRLLEMFHIVLEPSWSGYCLPEILFWTKYSQPVLVQASDQEDRNFLKSLGTNLVPISIGASDWVDHRTFTPLGVDKRFNAIYVANLSPVKRVHVYLRAIRSLAERGLAGKYALVVAGWGGRRASFEELVDYYEVRGQLEIFLDVKREPLNALICQSCVSVLLSRKEGSNKTLFESMFSNTPVILLKGNIGVNRDYINEQTGEIVEEADLADALHRFAVKRQSYTPRAWAMANIAPDLTTLKLSAALERIGESAVSQSAPLLVKVNSPEAIYMDESNYAKMPSMKQLLDGFRRETVQAETFQQTAARIAALFTSRSLAWRGATGR